jgi:probable HAF family extracellular repeat protein
MVKHTLTVAAVLLCMSLTYGQSHTVNAQRLTYISVDVPDALVTTVEGINTSGEMVGYYSRMTIGGAVGFTLRDGQFSFFTYPGGDSTFAYGITDSAVVVGTVLMGGAAFQGFTYDGITFKNVVIPGYPFTSADGVNNSGVLTGGATGSGNIAFQLSGTRFKNVTPPPGGFSAVYATGINNFNHVVGWTAGATTTGFQYRNGKFKSMEVPGAASTTEAWKINDSDVVVGWYSHCAQQGCKVSGFASRNGKYITLDYPGAQQTFALGINNAGQIVGSYTLDNTTYHGFVTSPLTAADFERPGCCLVDPNWKEE